MEIIGAIIVAIAELIGWFLIEFAKGLAWLVWMLAVGSARLTLGAYRLLRYFLRRRASERELTQIVLEYHAAVSDIRKIGADTRRQIREVSEGRRP
jgi:biopolymer transport protein ExbB/TolQ